MTQKIRLVNGQSVLSEGQVTYSEPGEPSSDLGADGDRSIADDGTIYTKVAGAWVAHSGGGGGGVSQEDLDLVESRALVLLPLTNDRNVIAPATDGAVALATTQGRVGVGTDFSAPVAGTDLGTARLVVVDESLAGEDEPMVQLFSRQVRPALRLYALDNIATAPDPFDGDGVYPWFNAFSEYRPSEHFGQDLVQISYGFHTPAGEPAFGGIGFGRHFYSDGFYIGARCDTLAGVTATPSEEYMFVGADLFLQAYPMRIYPTTKALRLDLDDIDTSLLAAGDFSISFDPTNGAAKFKIVGKTNDGTVVAAQVALA
jgi:hypothetical protein